MPESYHYRRQGQRPGQFIAWYDQYLILGLISILNYTNGTITQTTQIPTHKYKFTRLFNVIKLLDKLLEKVAREGNCDDLPHVVHSISNRTKYSIIILN